VWYDAAIAHRSDNLNDLARRAGLPESQFLATVARFNEISCAGDDSDFHRGRSAYDRYYGDPTITPNPNLRALDRGPFYAVKMVLITNASMFHRPHVERGLAILDHPANLNAPARWHLRSFGFLACNPFARQTFDPTAESAEKKLNPGETLHLRYRILVHDGAIDLKAAYREFAATNSQKGN